jgi:hypothetical protein
MNAESSEKPMPGEREILRPPLPDSMDGIRFEIGRILKYIQDGHKDPVVVTTAQKIAQLSADTARQLGQPVTPETRGLVWLEGLHAWCRANFEYVSNPANADVIKTPGRMLRELEVPEALSIAVWEPIRDQMAKAAGKDPSGLTLPKAKITGSSGVAVCLLLTLAAAIGLTPMRMRLGGHDGTIHYVWGAIHAGDRWRDVDILCEKFGEHPEFDTYEVVEILL